MEKDGKRERRVGETEGRGREGKQAERRQGEEKSRERKMGERGREVRGKKGKRQSAGEGSRQWLPAAERTARKTPAAAGPLLPLRDRSTQSPRSLCLPSLSWVWLPYSRLISWFLKLPLRCSVPSLVILSRYLGPLTLMGLRLPLALPLCLMQL